jgi:hypothetical protein
MTDLSETGCTHVLTTASYITLDGLKACNVQKGFTTYIGLFNSQAISGIE